MRIYALLSDPDNSELEKAIKAEFKDHHFDFEDGQWFIAANGATTAEEIYDKLEESKKSGDIGSVVVLSISGYYGYASANLWDWLASRSEA